MMQRQEALGLINALSARIEQLSTTTTSQIESQRIAFEKELNELASKQAQLLTLPLYESRHAELQSQIIDLRRVHEAQYNEIRQTLLDLSKVITASSGQWKGAATTVGFIFGSMAFIGGLITVIIFLSR